MVDPGISRRELAAALETCNQAIARLRQKRSGWHRELADTLSVAVRLAEVDAPSALNKLRIFSESVSKKTCVHLGVSFPRTKPPGLYALTKLLKGRAPQEMIAALEEIRPPANAGSHHTPKSQVPGEADLARSLMLAATIANAFADLTAGEKPGANARVTTTSLPPKALEGSIPSASASHTANSVSPTETPHRISKKPSTAPVSYLEPRPKITFVHPQAPVRPCPVPMPSRWKHARKLHP